MENMKINREKLNEVIINLRFGLDKYELIMDMFYKVDVSVDAKFQNLYKSFYGFRHPDVNAFSKGFFDYLERHKNKELEFDSVLKYLEQYGRIEASFASKLIATINQNKPVIDRYVLHNIGMRLPYTYTKNRFEKTIEVYRDVECWYQIFLSTEDASIMIDSFNKAYTNAKITNLKKIDLILWQMR